MDACVTPWWVWPAVYAALCMGAALGFVTFALLRMAREDSHE